MRYHADLPESTICSEWFFRDAASLYAADARGYRWGVAGEWYHDQWVLRFVRNGLSAAHRDYLAAGGLGAFLGDGRLNYGSEQILELYYSLALARNLWLTLDWQHIGNPGYNRDRGPVSIGSLRLHFEL